MPIKEKDGDIIFIETLKKSTLMDLLHFDSDNIGLFRKFGLTVNNTDKIAEAITKLISSNIKVNLLNYIDILYEEFEDKNIKDKGEKNNGKSENKKK